MFLKAREYGLNLPIEMLCTPLFVQCLKDPAILGDFALILNVLIIYHPGQQEQVHQHGLIRAKKIELDQRGIHTEIPQHTNI